MQVQEIIDFIQKVDDHFYQVHPDMSTEQQTLLRSMKLTEEVGELNEQILGHYGYARKEKQERYSQENLEHEIADVVFSALMIAMTLNIDVPKALANKMQKINKRFDIK